MASMVIENWGCIDAQDGFDAFEEIDGNLLMSLLDEEEGECDEERLTNVIRSLEAEISPIIIDGNNSIVELEWDGNWDGCHNLEGIQMAEGQDCSTQDGLDFNWMEVDHDMSNAYLQQPCEEYEGVGDCNSQISSNGLIMPLEEHGYASLWQETNASFLVKPFTFA